MFPRLEQEESPICDVGIIRQILSEPCFQDCQNINVLPLIYNEKTKQCNIMIFNFKKSVQNTIKIVKCEEGRGRKHPVYRFLGENDTYICEVRYGDAAANALQRGLWTHTEQAANCFTSISG